MIGFCHPRLQQRYNVNGHDKKLYRKLIRSAVMFREAPTPTRRDSTGWKTLRANIFPANVFDAPSKRIPRSSITDRSKRMDRHPRRGVWKGEAASPLWIDLLFRKPKSTCYRAATNSPRPLWAATMMTETIRYIGVGATPLFRVSSIIITRRVRVKRSGSAENICT